MSPALDYDRVADLYDAYVRSTDDIPFFLAQARRAAGPVLELMAGTGRVSIPLAAAGIPLTAVDASAGMLRVLQRRLEERGLAARLVHQDVTRLRLAERFALAFVPFNSFSEIVGEEERRRALEAIRDCLVAGGRLILTFHNPVVRLRSVGGGPTALGRFPLPGGAGSVELTTDLVAEAGGEQVAGVQTVVELDAAGGTVAEHRLPIRFALPRRDAVEAAAAAAGYRLEALWGDYQEAPFVAAESPFMILVLVAGEPRRVR